MKFELTLKGLSFLGKEEEHHVRNPKRKVCIHESIWHLQVLVHYGFNINAVSSLKIIESLGPRHTKESYIIASFRDRLCSS